MGLNKYTLGELIELCTFTNEDLRYGVNDVRGVNNEKHFMSTKVDLNGRDLSRFQLVFPQYYVFNHRTSRNGSKFSIAYNDTQNVIICTEDYVVFKIKDNARSLLDAYWLYMFFNRLEFDRYVIANSWGSSTEFYNWEDMCDIEIDLPPIDIQQKYVNIYKAMQANQKAYEKGLEDLKLVCDGYIEDLRRKLPCEEIGKYIEETNEKNEDGSIPVERIRGISIKKQFIDTKADTDNISAEHYKIVAYDNFAFNPNTARMGEKFCVALNKSNDKILVSAIYPTFNVIDRNILLPDYLITFFLRSEFDRYVRYNSWGSAREMFTYDDMTHVKIPIPDIKVQRSIADIYSVYIRRKEINQKLKDQLKAVCPVLVKGAMDEGRKT